MQKITLADYLALMVTVADRLRIANIKYRSIHAGNNGIGIKNLNATDSDLLDILNTVDNPYVDYTFNTYKLANWQIIELKPISLPIYK